MQDTTKLNASPAPFKVVGYMAVREPRMFARKHNLPRVYRGVDRDPWEDYVAPYYAKELPRHMQGVLDRVFRVTHNFTLDACRSMAELVKLDISALSPTSEIIGIWSALLESVWKPHYRRQGTLLGYDSLAIGEFSLILSALTSMDLGGQDSASFLAKLNDNGLFDNVEDAKKYADIYQIAAEMGLVEEAALWGSPPKIEPHVIAVYSIPWPSSRAQ